MLKFPLMKFIIFIFCHSTSGHLSKEKSLIISIIIPTVMSGILKMGVEDLIVLLPSNTLLY